MVENRGDASPSAPGDDLSFGPQGEANFNAMMEDWEASKKRCAKRPARSQPLSEPTRGTSRATPQSEELVGLIGECDLFHTPDAEPEAFVTAPVGEHVETFSIRSRRFRSWLSMRLREEAGRPPSAQAMSDALDAIEAEALYKGRALPVHVRVASHGEAIYIDLGGPSWEIVEISKSGWRVVSEHPVKFRRPRGLRELPRPVPGGTPGELREFVNVESSDFVLVLGWLVAAMRPEGPYPVLVLSGEYGSAKSTTARVLRALIDPNRAALRCEPSSARDLFIAAMNAWVLAFDNLSHLAPWLSDSLCRLATGGGLATRALYTDDQEQIFDATRPIILNGIDEALISRSDLADRAICITCPSIPEEGRKTEASFWKAFKEAGPKLQGALLDAVVCAMRNLPAVKLDRPPRMADFACWAVATEPALGVEPGAFMRAYAANRSMQHDLILEGAPMAEPILKLVSEGPFRGKAKDLLSKLESMADEALRHHREWPRNPRSLAGRLRRLAPDLRARGVNVEFGRGHERFICLSMREGGESPAQQAQQAQSSGSSPFAADVPAAANDSAGASMRPCAGCAGQAAGVISFGDANG